MMHYSNNERNKIKDLSFYCILDFLDETNNFQNAERNMKYERNKYLTRYGGYEEWRNKRDRKINQHMLYEKKTGRGF